MTLGLLCFGVDKMFVLCGVYGGEIFMFESAVLTPNFWNGSERVCAEFAW